MSKKTCGRVVLAGICGFILSLAGCGSSSSRPAGLLYVLTQGSNGVGNNISSFALDLTSGNLSLINSNASTCATTNACGAPLDILLDPSGATAFVLSQGAISSFTVNSDGSFSSPTTAFTVPSGNALAMTRDSAGTYIFVITDAPQLFVFSTTPGSTTLTLSNTVTLSKMPTALSSLTFPSPSGGTTVPCGFTSAEEFLYITSNHDLSSNHYDNALSVYCVGSSGAITDVTPTIPYIPQVDPISVLALNTNTTAQPAGGGVFVYVGSQPSASGAISIFQMCTQVGVAGCTQQDVSNAMLLPVGTTPPSTGQDPIAMVVDPSNNFLYVTCYLSNQVYAYQIGTSTGALTPLTPAYLSTGLAPVAMALHPSVNNTGQFLYTSNSGSGNISGFTLNTTSGVLSNAISVIAPAAPSGMAAR